MRSVRGEKLRRSSFAVLCITTLLVFVGWTESASSTESQQVVVALRQAVSVEDAVVRIGDVAAITGGAEALRQQIADLDLEDSIKPGALIEVSAVQVEFRLRLAGVKPGQAVIRGTVAEVTRSASHLGVTRAGSSLPAQSDWEQLIVNAVHASVSQRLPWEADNVVVRLAQPLPRELLNRPLSSEASCMVELRTTGAPVGRVSVRVVVTSSDVKSREWTLQFDVRHFEKVIVAARGLSRGHVLTRDDLIIDRQDVTSLVGYSSSPQPMLGQRIRRAMPAAQVIRESDLEEPSRVAAPMLVKRGAPVKLIATSGNLSVTTEGESLQEGRFGELIKVRNLRSKSVVVGRIISAQNVEVLE